MKLYYFKDKHGNFGDDLNPWFWKAMLGDCLDENDEELVVGIGTLINHRLPHASVLHVLGSGVGYGTLPDTKNLQVHFVRGPMSAERLNQHGDKAVTDPAILVPRLHPDKQEKKYQFGYMPHCDSDRLGDWKAVCEIANIKYITPRQNFKSVFDQICQCEVLLTEAMHGAIIADAYRVPFVPVKAYAHISEFKWQDWMLSMNLEFDFNYIEPLWYGDNNTTFRDAARSKLKRLILATGFWHKSWTKPAPRKSSKQQINKVIEQLNWLKSKPQFHSDNTVFKQKSEQMSMAISKAKGLLTEKYAKENDKV